MPFHRFNNNYSLIPTHSRCMMESTQGILVFIRQPSGRSLASEYFIHESLVTCGAGSEPRRRTDKIAKRPHDIAFFEVEQRDMPLNGDSQTLITQLPIAKAVRRPRTES